MKLSLLAVLGVSVALFITGCDSASSTPTTSGTKPTYKGTGPIKIVCTTGMVADLVKEIAGDRATVTHLMGPGVDPHLYKSSPSDAAALKTADVVFYSGLHLEGKMTELFDELAKTKPVVGIAEKIDHEHLLIDAGVHDPHVWFDVMLWQLASKRILDTLVEFDPEHALEYEERKIALTAKLLTLDHFCKEELKKIPADRRVLITAHDAFRYFGKAYNIEVRGIQGVSTDSEAGVKQINELVDFIVQRKIKAIFVETSVSEQNVKSLLEGCRSQNHEVVIGGSLFSDAMGEAGTPEGTYEGMIRHNVNTIVKALH